MKEIMEVLELWFPEGGKYFRTVAAQEIEELFRDLYNQYLVAEKGAVDFFDWLDIRDVPKPGWETFSVTCSNCDRETRIPYQALPTDHPDREPWDREVTIKWMQSTGEEKGIYFDGEEFFECKECGSFWLTGEEEGREKLEQEALGWISANKAAGSWNMADIQEAEEIILKLITGRAVENKPCINCGQTEGEIYQGPPHDHVCADCGRERPYEILCRWCRKGPRIQDGDLCRKCMTHLEDIGAVGEPKFTFDLITCGVCGKTISDGCKHWSVT